MLPFQYVTDAVVLAQPERGVHAEPRQKPKHLLAHRQLLLLGDGGRVDHVNWSIGDRGGVHLSIHHLGETRMGWQKGKRGEKPPWWKPARLGPASLRAPRPLSCKRWAGQKHLPRTDPTVEHLLHQSSYTPKLVPLTWHLRPAATWASGLGSPRSCQKDMGFKQPWLTGLRDISVTPGISASHLWRVAAGAAAAGCPHTSARGPPAKKAQHQGCSERPFAHGSPSSLPACPPLQHPSPHAPAPWWSRVPSSQTSWRTGGWNAGRRRQTSGWCLGDRLQTSAAAGTSLPGAEGRGAAASLQRMEVEGRCPVPTRLGTGAGRGAVVKRRCVCCSTRHRLMGIDTLQPSYTGHDMPQQLNLNCPGSVSDAIKLLLPAGPA